METNSRIISLVPEGSRHQVEGERVMMLQSVKIEILATRMIELKSWNLRELNDPFWRLYLPVSGEAIVTTEKRGEVITTRLTPNQAYLIPPRTTISSTHTGPFSKWYVHFTLGRSEDRVVREVYPVVVTSVMAAILEQLPKLKEGALPWISTGLVSEALQQLSPEVWNKRKVDRRVERAMDFMHVNLARKLTTNQVATAVGVSVRNLNHLFNQHIHMSPMRVVQDFRLDRACQLLRHSDNSIDQIADDCGFPNRNYFSRMLKQYRGTSPASYRKSEV